MTDIDLKPQVVDVSFGGESRQFLVKRRYLQWDGVLGVVESDDEVNWTPAELLDEPQPDCVVGQ